MDKYYMSYALELAKKGAGYTNPNPLVGAVIVKDGEIIGEGYHQYIGGPHAEVNAFSNTLKDPKGATMYVTLEPCSHYGKTPPCANKIIESGISKVVIGMIDPNPLVGGRGIQLLKDSGIDVVVGVLEDECKKINEIFLKFITTQLPFTILKTAMTLDGKIATVSGDSKWISNEKSRTIVHRLRHRVAGIMVGVGTVIYDDPLLNTRLDGMDGKNPIRIIVDTKAKIPTESRIVKTANDIRTILATTSEASKDKLVILEEKGVEIITCPKKNEKVDLTFLMKQLGKLGIDSILVEGGATLNYSLLSEELIDKVMFFIAPKLIGGELSKTPIGGEGINLMNNAIRLKDIELSLIDDDIKVIGYPQWEV